MFFVYVAKKFTASVTGRVLRPVTCEKCATAFSYALTRQGVGESSAPYMIGQDSAKAAAETSAVKNLEKRLAREVELVPCPNCEWVNAAAVAAFRRLRQRGWTWLGVVVLALALVIDLVIYSDSRNVLHRERSAAEPVLWIIGVGAFLFLAACLAVQWALRRRVNPNAGGPDGPVVPPGTPPAILLNPDGTHTFVPSTRPPDDDTRWAVFRVGELHYPPLCAGCLGPPDRVFKHPTTVGSFSVGPTHTTLAVPLCKRCARRYAARWWLAALASFAVTIPLAWLMVRVFHADARERGLIVGLYAVPLALAGIIVTNYLSKPYRFHTLDAHRGVFKIRFANPAYTAILIRKFAEAEGHFPQPAP